MGLSDSLGAISDADVAIKLDSTNFEYYVNRGWMKSNLSLYNEAILDYNKAIKIKESQKIFANRGLAFYKLGLYKNAIEDFNKSIFINSEDPAVLYFRGLSYMKIGKTLEACEDFSKSSKLGNKEAKIESKKKCIN